MGAPLLEMHDGRNDPHPPTLSHGMANTRRGISRDKQCHRPRAAMAWHAPHKYRHPESVYILKLYLEERHVGAHVHAVHLGRELAPVVEGDHDLQARQRVYIYICGV